MNNPPLAHVDSMSLDASASPKLSPPSRLTVFAVLWACQALVHQEYYPRWLATKDIWGTALTVLALVTMLRPSSLWLFAGMLLTSIIYNVQFWPFVVNHILLESVINAVILVALLWTLLSPGARSGGVSHALREQVYYRFAPVVAVMLVMMYYFAFLAKLNWDFVNPSVSCVVHMYDTMLLPRMPFLPATDAARWTVIVATLVVEGAIPVLLTFRRTRYAAVLLGVSFHLGLGVIAHRTFSAFAFALYGLFLMDELVVLAGTMRERFSRLSENSQRALYVTGAAASTLVVTSLVVMDLTGHFDERIGPVKISSIPGGIWLLWSLIIGAVYAVCVWTWRKSAPAAPPHRTTARPGLLWVVLVFAAFNGMSQYLGLKTQTCFTMYSNLRTEGPYNNHFFMPAWRLVSYQDDLVEIISTDLVELQTHIDQKELVTYFELRRILSATPHAFTLAYKRAGKLYELRKSDDQTTDSPLLKSHPLWLAKVLYFRPVSTAEHASCQH